MTEQNYVKDFGKRIVLISDEGHNLEEHILSFVTITIDSKTLHTIQSDLEFIDFKNDIKSWNSWLEDLKNSKIHSRIQELDLKIEVAKEKRQEVFSISNKSKRDSEIIQIEEEIKLYLQINEELESLVKRINFYLSDSLKNPENWVIEAKKAPFKEKNKRNIIQANKSR
jgi:Rad3-related DNA helicase